jgi:hypothetical protein
MAKLKKISRVTYGRLVIFFGDLYTYIYNVSETDKTISFSWRKENNNG